MISDKNYQKLSDSLTSENWKKLKSSLVGRELLSFGASLLTLIDSKIDYVNNIYDFYNPEMGQLLALAYSKEIELNLVCPSTIEVHRIQSDLISPFSLSVRAGASKFFNIDFTNSGDLVLFMGTPKRWITSQNGPICSLYPEMQTIQVEIKDDSINLGSDILLESIHVYKKNSSDGTDNGYSVVPSYTELFENSPFYYKARTFTDRTVRVELFGIDSSDVEIYALESSISDVTTVQSMTVQSMNGNEVTFKGNDFVQFGTDDTKNSYSTPHKGYYYDEEGLVSQLKGKTVCGVISNEESLLNFLNSKEWISDSIYSEGTVFIKTTEENMRVPDTLITDILLNSVLGFSIDVKKAELLRLQLLVKSQVELSNSIKIEISKLLFNELTYSHATFSKSLNFDFLIKSITKVPVDVSFLAHEFGNNLTNYPIPSSIKFYDDSENLVGITKGYSVYHLTPLEVSNSLGMGDLYFFESFSLGGTYRIFYSDGVEAVELNDYETAKLYEGYGKYVYRIEVVGDASQKVYVYDRFPFFSKDSGQSLINNPYAEPTVIATHTVEFNSELRIVSGDSIFGLSSDNNSIFRIKGNICTYYSFDDNTSGQRELVGVGNNLFVKTTNGWHLIDFDKNESILVQSNLELPSTVRKQTDNKLWLTDDKLYTVSFNGKSLEFIYVSTYTNVKYFEGTTYFLEQSGRLDYDSLQLIDVNFPYSEIRYEVLSFKNKNSIAYVQSIEDIKWEN